jgi:hypothetical protein
MSDITAVVLTIGEKTFDRAVDSIMAQTLPPKELVVVRNREPFHKAFRSGVRRVKTDFFVQVDSDMVLDKNCFHDFRTLMGEDVGIVMGLLRDQLLGRISGVKMFRKRCFQGTSFKDSLAPDTDFYADMAKRGWQRLYALNHRSKSRQFRHTFGDHEPEYTPLYTFCKFYVFGRRCWYRRDLGRLMIYFAQLHNTNKGISLIAQIGLAQGVFGKETGDLLRPFSSHESFDRLNTFLEGTDTYNVSEQEIMTFFDLNPKETFRHFYRLGGELGKRNAYPKFKECMDYLSENRNNSGWLGKLGLCLGLFSNKHRDNELERAWQLLDTSFSMKPLNTRL